MKEKILLAGTIILALGLSISGILLAKGKMFAMSAESFTANALLATANKEKFMGMAENWKGMATFAQSLPPVLAMASVFVIAIGAAIALVLFSHSLSKVYIERNKYLVTSGTVAERKLLGRGVPVRSFPFPVVGGPDSPDPDEGSLEGDDPDKPEQEPYINPAQFKSRISKYVSR